MARIIVIDQDEADCSLCRRVLETAGHDVECVSDAAHGMRLVSQETFDAIVVDILMPDLDGLETVMALHRAVPRTPIIAISGYVFLQPDGTAPDFLHMAVELGATGCVRKPLSERELSRQIEACLPPREQTAA